MNLLLCGMPGSGKSRLGKLAAKRLKRTFIDTDSLVVKEYFKLFGLKSTCREISLKEGELFFRRLENEVVKRLAIVKDAVIALGGGTLCVEENVQIIKASGKLIYLKVDPKIILMRLMRKEVLPFYLNPADVLGSFNALLMQRLPLYQLHSHLCIDADKEDPLEILCN